MASGRLTRCITNWLRVQYYSSGGGISRLIHPLSHHHGHLEYKRDLVTHQGGHTKPRPRMSINEQQQQDHDQKITPWDVEGEVVDGVLKAIDYEKLMKQFGCQPLSQELIDRLERLTGKKAHVLIRRGMFYCHRYHCDNNATDSLISFHSDFNLILDLYEQKKPFYLYTGRGPSSDSMHIGHMIPFLVCKYLQEIFDCHLVIQMTDDEKFLFKDLQLDEVKKFTIQNAKDIIAVGFNPEKTFIFQDTQYFGNMYEVILKVQKCLLVNQSNHIFGFDETCNVGKVSFPCTQIAPAFSAAFPHLFGGRTDVPCLIPYAIDQDPYFRIGRDIAPRLKYPKSTSLCSSFFPALQGFHSKMSSSTDVSAIFMTDTAEQIKKKINKYAFSGGQATLEEQREKGANLAVDVPYQYLRFFMEDDAELERIGQEYAAGRMMTGEVKGTCIQILTDFILAFQARRAAITPELFARFTSNPPTKLEREQAARIAELETQLKLSQL